MKKRTPLFLLLTLALLVSVVAASVFAEKRGESPAAEGAYSPAPTTPGAAVVSPSPQATPAPRTPRPTTAAPPAATAPPAAPASTPRPAASDPLPGYDPPDEPPGYDTPASPSADALPSENPVPEDKPLGSGSFSSNTGLGLDVRADWSASASGESGVEVTVSVSAVSYSLRCDAMSAAVNVNLDGQYVSLDAPAIDYNGSAAVSTLLASRTFSVSLAQGESRNLALEVVWNFGGSYGGAELPALECGGVISLSR